LSTLLLAIGSLFPPAEPGVSFCQPKKQKNPPERVDFLLDKSFFTSKIVRAKLNAINNCADAIISWFTLERKTATLEEIV